MTLKKINYTKEDAIHEYLTNYRNRILNELKINEVQNKVKRRLLNLQDKEDVDLVFYKDSIDEVSMEDMSRLLSEGATCIEENIKYTEDDMTCKEDANTQLQQESTSDTVDIPDKTPNMEYKKLRKRMNKFIDIEAECSEEEYSEEEEEYMDEDVLDDMCEEDDEIPSVYFEEKARQDEMILKGLKRKFKKRRVVKDVQVIREESEEENEACNELEVEIEKVQFSKKAYDTVKREESFKKEESFKEEDRIEFSNVSLLGKKINKKAEMFKFQRNE